MSNKVIKSIFAVLMVTSGLVCASTAYELKNPDRQTFITPLPKAEGWTVQRRFHKKITRHNFLWGLVVDEEKNLDFLLAQVAKKGEVIGDLQIKEEYTFVNAFLDLITIGLYRPYTVRIRGQVYTKGDLKNGGSK